MISHLPLLLIFFFVCESRSQGTDPFRQILGPRTADIKAAAEKGDAEAQCNLAKAYCSSFAWSNAVVWFKKSARQGNSESQYNLGKMLANGAPGVSKNIGEGIKWLTLAANQDHAMAQMKLGECYEKGTGVKQDYIEAYKLYLLLAKQMPIWRGYPDRLSLKMTTAQIGEAKERARSFIPAKPSPVETEIKLQGILGSAEKRLAMIGGKTFQKGEQAAVKIDDETLSVKCLEIGDATAKIQINDGKIVTLFLAK